MWGPEACHCLGLVTKPQPSFLLSYGALGRPRGEVRAEGSQCPWPLTAVMGAAGGVTRALGFPSAFWVPLLGRSRSRSQSSSPRLLCAVGSQGHSWSPSQQTCLPMGAHGLFTFCPELQKGLSSPPPKRLLLASTVVGGEPTHTQSGDLGGTWEPGRGTKRATGQSELSVTTPSSQASPVSSHTGKPAVSSRPVSVFFL